MNKQIEIHIHKTYRTEGAYAGYWFREVSWRDERGEWYMSCAPRAKEAARIARRTRDEFTRQGFSVSVRRLA
jgi:hypothetical protein